MTNIRGELVDKTSYLFQENCQELPGISTYLFRISFITRSQDFRKVYVGVPWNILGQIQKFNVFSFHSASGDDLVYNFCSGGC